MLILKFLTPHTLKVNELPKHSHIIPGYNWWSVGTSRFHISTGEGAANNKVGMVYNNSSNIEILGEVDDNAPKVYRAFRLGVVSDESPTTNQGNNESPKNNLD